MDDTFFSWFLVTELHIWMLSVRLMAEGTEEGRHVRNSMVQGLWKDCDERWRKAFKGDQFDKAKQFLFPQGQAYWEYVSE